MQDIAAFMANPQVTEIQAHIGLGALLGYPVADLHGIHKALCRPPHNMPCSSFDADADAAISAIARVLPHYSSATRDKLICYQLRRMEAAMRSIRLNGIASQAL